MRSPSVAQVRSRLDRGDGHWRLLLVSWSGEVPMGSPEALCGVDVGQREFYTGTFRQEGSNVSRFRNEGIP